MYFLGLMSWNKKESNGLNQFIDVLCLLAQITGFIIWPLLEFGRDNTKILTTPVAILLISTKWWENYVDKNSQFVIIKRLGKVKGNLQKTRNFIYTFIPVINMLLFVFCMGLFLHLNGVEWRTLFSQFHEVFSSHTIEVFEMNNIGHDGFLPNTSAGLYTLFTFNIVSKVESPELMQHFTTKI